MQISISHPASLLPAAGWESCWAAAAAMLFGGHRPLPARHALAAGAAGDGAAAETIPPPSHRAPADLSHFARLWGLEHLPPRPWSLQEIAGLLAVRPLWVGAYRLDGHAMVLSGMLGDGTPGGTYVTLLDPLPAPTGARHTLPYSVFAARFHAPALHILHRPPLPPRRDPVLDVEW